MPYTNALTKLTAGTAAVATEIAMIQTSASVSEWALKNAGLLLAIGAGLVGYGRLQHRVETLREQMATKASNEKVDLMDKKLDTIHDDVAALRDHLIGRPR